MMEISLGQTAIEKGFTDGVRKLGQRMVDDYTRWLATLRRASERLNLEIPSALDAKQQAEVDKITALSGAAFDQAFLKEMIRLQNKALTVTAFEATNAGVSGFRRWATAVAPSMEGELLLAKQNLNDSRK
jgi:putative membrane protein